MRQKKAVTYSNGLIQYKSTPRIIAELCNGITADSDSVCLGSNPSSAANTGLGADYALGLFIVCERIIFPYCPEITPDYLLAYNLRQNKMKYYTKEI